MNFTLPWQRAATSVSSSSIVYPSSLAKHPQRWTKEEVGVWLQWCTEEYSIEPVPAEKFDLNGKALCLLSRSDFIERLPKNGDVLYNCLQTLISRLSVGSGIIYPSQLTPPITECRPASLEQTGITSEPVPTGLLLVPSTCSGPSTLVSGPPYSTRNYVPIMPHPVFSAGICDTPSLSTATKDCRLLWEFIYQLLLNTEYSGYVCWEQRDEYVFRIVNPTGLAELWGQQKNRTNMTYEKLSRALRYYYRMNIIKKVPGKRLTYRFLQSPTRIQKGQRGAKPHSKYHLSYNNSAGTNSTAQSPRSTEQSIHKNSPVFISSPDIKDSSSDMNDEFENESNPGETNTVSLHTKDEGRVNCSPSINSIRENSDLFFRQFQDPRSFDSQAIHSISLSNFSRTSADIFNSPSSAFHPVQHPVTIKSEKTKSDLVPYFPIPGASSPSFHMRTGRSEDAMIRPSTMPLFDPTIDVNDNFRRSLSTGCAQLSLYKPKCFNRPKETRSASPRTDVQLEPEDLSLKKKLPSESVSANV